MNDICKLPSTEEDAVAYFQQYGILPSKKLCVNGHDMNLYLKTDKQWRCNVKCCQKRVSLRKDTFFEGFKLSFVTALRFMYSWSRELTSIHWAKEHLELSDKTVIEWNNFMREVCMHSLQQRDFKKIGGPNKIVEINEILFAERNSLINQMLPQQWIFGGLCRETNECFIVKVPNRSMVTLLEEIEQNIEDGSTIFSNSWETYISDEVETAGFKDFKVNHSYKFVNTTTSVPMQNTENVWGLDEWRNKKHRRSAPKPLDSYFCEFMWRQIHKDDDLFVALLQDIKDFCPPL